MGQALSASRISDDDLLHRLSRRVKKSRCVDAELVADIGEVDARRLYRRQAAPSMFEYCVRVLHLSEAEAYLRITVARLARRHPVLLDMLGEGRLHLSGIERLGPHLTARNRDDLLERATHKSKKEIEEIVAGLAPRPDVPSTIRKLPQRRAAEAPATPQLRPDGVSTAASELRPAGVSTGSALSLETPASPSRGSSRRPQVEPLGDRRYKVTFMADAVLHEKLERLQALMRAAMPDVDLAKAIDVAVTRELERVEARRFARTKDPRKKVEEVDTTPSSRKVPAPVRRAVYERDGGRCTYSTKQGRRCTRRHDLELHHEAPYAKGGRHSLENLRLLCKLCRGRHNRHYAERSIMPTVAEMAPWMAGNVRLESA